MAGDWIKFEKATIDKPEVFEIAEALGIEDDAVIGKLLRVWAWADSNCHADGVTSVTLLSRIDRMVSVPNFGQAMIKVGWLIRHGDQLEFTNFDRHNGKPAKNRALATDRKRESRFCHDASVTKSGLEKRREEVKEKDVYDVLKESRPPSSSPQADPAGSSDQRPDRRPRAMRKPESMEECLVIASRIGVDASDARAWYADMSAADWRDRDGFPLNNWPRALTSHRNILQERRARLGRDKVVAPKTQSDVMAKGLAELDAIFKD